jgi:hypothetical protein
MLSQLQREKFVDPNVGIERREILHSADSVQNDGYFSIVSLIAGAANPVRLQQRL